MDGERKEGTATTDGIQMPFFLLESCFLLSLWVCRLFSSSAIPLISSRLLFFGGPWGKFDFCYFSLYLRRLWKEGMWPGARWGSSRRCPTWESCSGAGQRTPLCRPARSRTRGPWTSTVSVKKTQFLTLPFFFFSWDFERLLFYLLGLLSLPFRPCFTAFFLAFLKSFSVFFSSWPDEEENEILLLFLIFCEISGRCVGTNKQKFVPFFGTFSSPLFYEELLGLFFLQKGKEKVKKDWAIIQSIPAVVSPRCRATWGLEKIMGESLRWWSDILFFITFASPRWKRQI